MITKRSLPTFEAKIYVGFRHGYLPYSQVVAETKDPITLVREVCEEMVKTGWCLSIQPIEYIYTKTKATASSPAVGGEPGVVVGVINYPKYPSSVHELRHRIIELASKLMERLKQTGVSVVFTDETLFIEPVVSTEKLQ